MGSWMNSDGLYIKYGSNEGVSTSKSGAFECSEGGVQVVELTLDLTKLTTTNTVFNDVVFIPRYAYITYVETVAVVGAATGTAINVGLINRDRSTEIDYDGLLAAAPTANMNTAGETSRYQQAVTVPASLTGVGALVGTEMTTSGGGYITAARTDATAFTAGIIKVRIAYIPMGKQNP